MSQKSAKKLRRLASYIRPDQPQMNVEAHGKRETFKSITVTQESTSRRLKVKTREYLAYTVTNTSKFQYKKAKKAFRELKKTFNNGAANESNTNV